METTPLFWNSHPKWPKKEAHAKVGDFTHIYRFESRQSWILPYAPPGFNHNFNEFVFHNIWLYISKILVGAGGHAQLPGGASKLFPPVG